MNELKCKNCPYYTGMLTHGHGEFWGECNLLKIIRNNLAIATNNYKYDIKIKFLKNCWEEICYDETICKLIVINKDHE